jgi:amylosucrase
VAFKAEAIVGPRDLVQYLGTGRHAGRVSDLAYHNSLMVQVWSMLAARNTVLARRALGALPATPATGTWITYVRCHDDIGWAIDDRDAYAVGVTGQGHRAFLSDWYSGEFPGTWADGLVFQANPATGDRRISGTAASLVGLPEDPDAGLARLLLAHAVVAGWGGIPVVWSGDELGQPNDPDWAREPGHEDDNRWAHRPRLDPRRARDRDDPDTVAGRVFGGLRHLATVRAGLPQLHASADTEVLQDTDDGVLAVVRRHASGPFVGLYNVTGQARPFELHRLHDLGLTVPYDALAGHPVPIGSMGLLWLPPYAAWWVIDAPTRPQQHA